MKTKRVAPMLAGSMAMLAMFGCDGEAAVDHTEIADGAVLQVVDEAARATRASSLPLTVFHDDIGDAGQDETLRVITSASAYYGLFGNAPPSGLRFDREWVLFYSAGVQPTGGYGVSFDGLTYDASRRLLRASARLREPGEGCFVPQILTTPHVLARFSIPSPTPRYIASTVVNEVVDCEEPEPAIELTFDFRQGAQQWSGHFADLPADFAQTDYNPIAGIATLPSELGTGTGFFLGGTNRSDDLWMGMERRIGIAEGLEPGRAYTVEYTIRFGSKAPSGCFGVGGAPGEGVYLKAGAAPIDPEVIEVAGDDFLRLNIDKDNQAQSGVHASVTGDIANGLPCDDPDTTPYVSLTRTHEHAPATTTDNDGNMWLVIGTDSAFESRTELYYQSVVVRLTPQ